VRRDKDDDSDNGNTPSLIGTLVDRDGPNLGEEYHDKSTQTIVAASEIDGTSSVIGTSSYHEHDTGLVEKDGLLKAGQAAPVVNISAFGEAPLLIAEHSPETSALNLYRIGKDDLVTVKILKFTVTKILGKRLSPYKIKYEYQLEPLWLPVDWVKEI
jgi:hypothetical protein